jgi:hypothetical protein
MGKGFMGKGQERRNNLPLLPCPIPPTLLDISSQKLMMRYLKPLIRLFCATSLHSFSRCLSIKGFRRRGRNCELEEQNERG